MGENFSRQMLGATTENAGVRFSELPLLFEKHTGWSLPPNESIISLFAQLNLPYISDPIDCVVGTHADLLRLKAKAAPTTQTAKFEYISIEDTSASMWESSEINAQRKTGINAERQNVVPSAPIKAEEPMATSPA